MDIDLVYLWVDGNDPVWLTKKNEFLPADRQVDPQVAGECRYVENDELRYSLRSVEKFAPWIRRVYIVTDDQTPAWLDTSNLRIRVVSHREIMPAEILPVFNSCTIELFLPRIPGLAEHFLYANDDMFFSRPVDPGFFFDWQGRPIVRLKVQSLKKHDDDIYCHTILRMQDLVRARYGRLVAGSPPQCRRLPPQRFSRMLRDLPGRTGAYEARPVPFARRLAACPGALRCVGARTRLAAQGDPLQQTAQPLAAASCGFRRGLRQRFALHPGLSA